MNALDLIVIVPEVMAFEDIVQRIDEVGGHAEIILDRRRVERRRAASASPDERRRGDRRTLDVGEPLRAVGWALVPGEQRPASRDATGGS